MGIFPSTPKAIEITFVSKFAMKLFRNIALLEGISFLMILFISMPLKYLFDMPTPNKIIGMAHGVLFVAYVILAIQMKIEKEWSIKQLAIILVASIIPAGTFYIDKKYLKQ